MKKPMCPVCKGQESKSSVEMIDNKKEQWKCHECMTVFKSEENKLTRKTVQVAEPVKTELKKLQDLYGMKSESILIAFLIEAHQDQEISAMAHIRYVQQAKKMQKEPIQMDFAKIWKERRGYKTE